MSTADDRPHGGPHEHDHDDHHDHGHGPGEHGHDVGGGEHRRPGHGRTEGEYEDRDVTGEQDVEAVGSYVDRDVTPGEQEQPRDEGEYTDRDEPPGTRSAGDEGEYPDVDPREASHHRIHTERDDTHG